MRRPLVFAVYVAIAVMWGSTWLFIRIGLRDLPPLFFAGIRMALAALLLAPLAARGGALSALLSSRQPVLMIALLQVALPYGLMFVAQQYVPSGLSAVLFATFPVWLVLLSRLFLREALTPRRTVSALLGVAGVVLLEAPRLADLSASRLLVAGSALIVLASMVVAVANLYARAHILRIPPIALTAGQSAVGGAVLLATSLFFERGHPLAVTPSAAGVVLYLAVFGSGLTYMGLYWIMPRISTAALGILPLIDTAVAVTLGALVLDEPVGGTLFAGGGLVLAAAALASTPAKETS